MVIHADEVCMLIRRINQVNHVMKTIRTANNSIWNPPPPYLFPKTID